MCLQISDVRTEVFLYAMLAVGAADTALLHAGMESLDSLKVETVDICLAKLELTDTTCGTVDVVGEYRRGQTIFAIISPLDYLIEVVPHDDGEHGTEGLLMRDVHILTAVVKQCGSIEIALVAYTVTAAQHHGALTHGILDLGLYAFQSTFPYQRAHADIVSRERVTDLDSLEFLDEFLGESILDILVHIQALGIVAYLAVIAYTAVQDSLSGAIEVCVGEYNHRSLTTELERHLGDIRCGILHDIFACADRTGDADNINLGACGEFVTHHAAFTGNNVEKTCGETDLVDNFSKSTAVDGSELRGFEHDRTSGYKSGAGLTGYEEEREVPGQDTGNDTDRFLGEENCLAGIIAGDYLTLDMAGERAI